MHDQLPVFAMEASMPVIKLQCLRVAEMSAMTRLTSGKEVLEAPLEARTLLQSPSNDNKLARVSVTGALIGPGTNSIWGLHIKV